MRNKGICLLLALLVMLALPACGRRQGTESAPSPTPAAVFATAPAQTSATPRPAPTASATPKPTAAPTATPTPVETPELILENPTATAAPTHTTSTASMPAPSPTPAFSAFAPVITKQPSGEGHYAGESAVFITYADKWTSLAWTAVSPSGREIDLNTFRDTFPDSTVLGDSDTTLTITNLNIDMSGWSFYCTFTNESASAKTNNARLKVTGTNAAALASAANNNGGETASWRIPHCPNCGEQVDRSMLNCPYCGFGFYDGNADARYFKDQNGDIFYYAPTGSMHYENSTRSTTIEDTNGNYVIIDANGKPTFGNYAKEQQAQEERDQLIALGVFS